MKKYTLSLLLVTSLYSSEVSVFDAGNLDSNNPYGLTNSEKHILKNKKELDIVDSHVKVIKSSINELSQRVDGVVSITDTNSIKIEELNKRIDKVVSDIVILKKNIEDSSKYYNENTSLLKSLISDLSKAVSEINKNYVSTKEFKTNMEQFINKPNKIEDVVPEKPKKVDSKNVKAKVISKDINNSEKIKEEQKAQEEVKVKEDVKLKEELKAKEDIRSEDTKKVANIFAGKSSKDVYTQAKSYYESKGYSKSFDAFTYLAEKNFKAAESNYYLGLISFEKKKYNEAIGFFKQSALLNDNASYMSKLLLRSAESFEKLGKVDNAKKFYSALSEGYPSSEEAEVANKKLIKLK